MRRNPPRTFDRPILLLCEGPSDQALFQRLIANYVTDNHKYQVEFVNGNNGFGDSLKLYLDTSDTFRDNVKTVLIVTDKDDSPENSFNLVVKTLQDAQFPVPTAPNELATKNGYPSVYIFMIPIRSNGNLETMCLQAMEPKWNMKAVLDNLIHTTPANAWGHSKQSKARMQVLMATVCEPQPSVSFSQLWGLAQEYHVPIGDPCFEELVQFFKNYPSISSVT